MDSKKIMNKKKHSTSWYIVVAFIILAVFGFIISIGNSSKNTASSEVEATKSSEEPTFVTIDSPQKSVWRYGYFVDEFGDVTQEEYLVTSNFYGSFSNSATNNSSLKWNFLVTRDYVAFILYEYDKYQVKGYSSLPTSYQVNIKKEDETVVSFKAKNANDRIKISNSNDYQMFLSILNEGKKIKISIIETGTPTSYNLGSLDCVDFAEEFKNLK